MNELATLRYRVQKNALTVVDRILLARILELIEMNEQALLTEGDLAGMRTDIEQEVQCSGLLLCPVFQQNLTYGAE